MQDIFIGAINFIEKMLSALPTLQINNMTEIQGAIDTLFISFAKTGYIVPYDTVIHVLIAVATFRAWKMRLFIKNWLIQRIWH